MTILAGKNDIQHLPCALVPYTLKIRAGCAGGVKEL